MRLFRAISFGEYALLKRGRFLTGPNSMGGKWFAESLDDAYSWGRLMVFDPGFIIVEIEISAEVADNLFRIEWLDNIGPARYAEIPQLVDATIISFQNVS